MNAKHSLLAVALGLLLGGAASAAPLSAGEAQALLERNGFSDISPLEYRDGAWVGTAINRDGDLADVRINPDSKEVTWSTETSHTTVTTTTTTREPVEVVRSEPVEIVRTEPVVVEETAPVVRRPIVVAQRVLVPVGGRLNKKDIYEVLAAAGYHNVHDVEYLSRTGVWRAKGRDPSDADMELHIDPADGGIVRIVDY